ncbi:hypothetical protein ABT124_25865 [Streptomyces sp. NPDC001982]|uniref:hypothetical protein n=1 Tax=Streptomyces sp. NPDC001982 TaxID=3154405 RepID=UPI00332247D8
MTQTDIALLLADAADEVEIGIAPVQAVMRGGRRRRARRWAVAAATAVVLAGSTGATVALTGLHGGGDGTVAPATRRPAPDGRQVDLPQRTQLAAGTDRGTRWRIVIDVWEAPRDRAEAQVQLDAMREFREAPVDVHRPADLVGKGSFFVKRGLDGDTGQIVLQNTLPAPDAALSGKDLFASARSLRPTDPDDAERLVIGQVAVTAQQVTCTWKNGMTSVVSVVSEGYEPGDMVIRPVAGSSANWFVCLAPAGTAYKSVEVTK